MMGQGRQHRSDLRHDRFHALLRILQHHEETAGALDHRGDVGGTELLAKQRKVSLPVPELLAMGDDIGTEQGAEFRSKFRRRALARPIAAAAPAARGQVASQVAPAAFLGVDMPVDGLVADPDRCLLVAHAARNLLGGPGLPH